MPESSDKEREPRLNALKHGCCAKSPVLPGEDEAHWREVEDEWFTEYNPQTPVSRTLVGEAVLAFWFMARNRRQFERVNVSLAQKHPIAWTEEDHMNYSRFLRYKTAADRAFNTAFKNLEYLRKTRMSEAEALRRLDLKLEAMADRQLKEQNKLEIERAKLELEKWKHIEECKAKGIPTSVTLTPRAPQSPKIGYLVEQHLEVTVMDGVTRTAYSPTNEELLQAFEETESVPGVIYRHFHFPGGIPPEYVWIDPKDATQRLLFETWLQLLEQEDQTPGRHAGPNASG